MKTIYYYLVMSQKDLLQNQVMEEVLREKASYYNSRKKNLDYWILISPDFLFKNNLIKKIQSSKFYNQKLKDILIVDSTNKEMPFYATLVSLDKEFMDWIKLRLGYFENIDELNKSENSNLNYVSDGVYGEFEIEDKSIISILKSNSNLLHPDIFVAKFKKSIERYLSLNFV
jgi:hypothetical protein